MITDDAEKIIREALTLGDEQSANEHLIANVDKLPEEVQNRLRLSVLENAFRTSAEQKTTAADFLEVVVNAKTQADAQVK